MPDFQNQNDKTALPQLRQELKIERGAAMFSGAPGWLIIDPIRHRYFKIGQEVFELLALWHLGSFEKIIKKIKQNSGRIIDQNEVANVVKFLHINSLTIDPPSQNWKAYLEQDEARQNSIIGKMMHQYLFFKIPLVRPENFLQFFYPIIRPLFTKTAIYIWLFLTLIGLYLTSRQWDDFINTFLHFLSFNGVLLWLGSLIFVKIIHELGHGFMCTHYRLKVPVMGVAFMVLMPVLYTDTSAAWQLKNPRSRLKIDAGGIFAELGLAGLATLFWVFLPEGGAKSVAFTIATTSWIFSLAVNLNPFMRFDGYYLMSDTLDINNLQQRGFAMARWKLRELLFGIKQAPPEYFNKTISTTIILHAWGTWIYRFFLFLGIAFLVYAFFIKIIGILLFAVEIIFFIFLPIFRELKQWWKMKNILMKSQRSWITGMVLIGLIFSLAYPFHAKVKIPAIMEPQTALDIYVPLSAQLEKIHVKEGDYVEKGAVIFSFKSDLIEQNLNRTSKQISMIEKRLSSTAVDKGSIEASLVLEAQLVAEQEKRKGFERQLKALKMSAPIGGIVKDLDRAIEIGQWINPNLRLATLIEPNQWRLRGYVNEGDLFQIEPAMEGVFIADNPFRKKQEIMIKTVAEQGEAFVEIKALSSLWGGPIASKWGEKKEAKAKAKPLEAIYQVDFALKENEDAGFDKIIRGVVILKGKPIAFSTKIFRQISKIIIREFGF